MMRLMCPSTLPELHRRVSPAVTASWSARRPVTKDRSAGSPVAATAVIHGSSSVRPRRSVMISANDRTLPATAASSGDTARMASRLALSAAASLSGLVMIQPVTALTLGGTGAGTGVLVR